MWRLSSTGRKRLGIIKSPLAFNSQKVEHVLGVGDVFQALFASGRLQHFQYEPKDTFSDGKKVYAPDAFFYLKGLGAFLLEFQRSSLSSERWALKWTIADAFFESGAYKSAGWQPPGKVKVKPQIVVVTSQQEETVKGGTWLNLTIVKKIEDIL